MSENSLRDSYGRAIGDLRVSVTDRCNFRCTYCIPVENIEWKRKEEILSYEEIVRLISIFASLGVHKLRLTGGEPLLRPDLPKLIESVVRIPGIQDVALTTNGKLLPAFAEKLRDAGIQRLNVSLDSLQPAKFFFMTKRDVLGEVLEGLEAAQRAGFYPIKINAVVIRGINDDEIVDFARFAQQTGHTVRFIEFMPLDSGHVWSKDQVVTGKEILDRIRAEIALVPRVPRSDAETARRYGFETGEGEIGIIAPVSDPFCGNCNRLRLTADGQLRTCLFSIGEHDLKGPIRRGATDDEVRAIIATAVFGKELGHRINQPEFVQPARTMSCIGG